MASVYLVSTDITDVLARQLVTATSTLLDRVDDEIEDLAERVGLTSVDEIVTPLHYGIKKWAAAWLTMTIFLEYMGQNSIDLTTNEKYAVKFEFYKKVESDLRRCVTKEMFLDVVQSNTDRAPTFNRIVRG